MWVSLFVSTSCLFFLVLPCYRAETGQSAIWLYFLFFQLLPVLGLYSPFSSSSNPLRSLFTQSSHLSCGLPRLLQPLCLFVPLFSVISHLSIRPYVQPISSGSWLVSNNSVCYKFVCFWKVISVVWLIENFAFCIYFEHRRYCQGFARWSKFT